MEYWHTFIETRKLDEKYNRDWIHQIIQVVQHRYERKYQSVQCRYKRKKKYIVQFIEKE